MKNVCPESDYKSAWRLLSRENDPNTTGSPSSAETSKKNIINTETLTMADDAPEKTNIINKIAEISADINTLNQRIVDQGEKINYLLSLLEEKEAAGKKNNFGLPRK